ncbi:MAG TPA: glycosyltransferase [Stellaceae bacterium]|nr:glycosyltransferase [Stellaceae bacterium]
MAAIVMADDGIAFDGAMAEREPLGGAEIAFVALAEALAQRRHKVEVRNRCRTPVTHNGVSWAPLAGGVPERCDLYIGNRGHRTIGLVRRAGVRIFWLHNPAFYLRKPRNLWRLARWRPTLVVTGAYHRATVPRFLPGPEPLIIPYGILDPFRAVPPREPPPPRAIFTSNPLRGLDWLLDLWETHIAPAVPQAELHIYAGAAVYGLAGSPAARRIEAILDRAGRLAALGVICHPPVGHADLAERLRGARVMLYRGDPGETFCLAVAEAQAAGVPAVVTPLGALAERVVDDATGRVAPDDKAFAAAAISALRDDALWRRWHRAALASQRGCSWDEAAVRFESLMR